MEPHTPAWTPAATTDPVPPVTCGAPARRTARLPRITDAFPQPVLLVDCNGTVVGANTAAVDGLQAPTTHLLGRGVLDILPQFDLGRTPGGVACDDDRDDEPTHMTVRCTDGFEFTAEVAIRLVRRADLDDEPASPMSPPAGPAPHGLDHDDRDFLMVTVTDVTSQLSAERACRRLNRQTELILRATAEGIVGVDMRGRIVLANPAATRLLGRPASELRGRELLPLALHSTEDGSPLPPEESPLTDTLRTGRSHHDLGAVLWGRDDTWHPVRLSTVPMTDEGHLVGAVVAFTDRSAVHAAAVRRDRLAAVLDHELRAPLDRTAQILTHLVEDPAGVLWPEANRILRQLAEDCGQAAHLADRLLQPADGSAQPTAELARRQQPAAHVATTAATHAQPAAQPSAQPARRGRHADNRDDDLPDAHATAQRSRPFGPPPVTVPGTVVDAGPPRRRHRQLPAAPRIVVRALEAGTTTSTAPSDGRGAIGANRT
ncbi:PAS domain-containing protein [Embleya sp. NPDC020886]|uniref:PAS domain-containing protein n=1 Tax=Embleya sp. NPDC020886 TaxID=3363980 RepID=UPI00379EF4DD